MQRIISTSLGGYVEPDTAMRLIEAAGGDLNVLRELLRLGKQSHRLRETNGAWAWVGELVAHGDRLLIAERRLAHLAIEERQLLELVAVGEPLAARVLEGVADPRVSAKLEALGFIALDQTDRRSLVRLVRPIEAEILRSACPPLWRRSVNRFLADSLDGSPRRRRVDTPELAQRRLHAGQWIPDSMLAAAIDSASSQENYGLAAELAAVAVERTSEVHAKFTLGKALAKLGRHSQAEHVFATLEGAAIPDDQVASITVERAMNLATMQQPEAAERLIDGVLGTEVIEPARTQLEAARASLLALAGRPHDALTLSETIVNESAADESARRRATAVLVATYSVTGSPERALAVASVATDGRADDAPERPRGDDPVAFLRWEALWFAGNLEEAQREAQLMQAHAVATGSDQLRAVGTFRLALCLRSRGGLRRAADLLLDVVAATRNQNNGFLLVPALAALAETAGQYGDAGRARTALFEAEREGRVLLPGDRSRLARAKAWLHACEGRLSLARQAAYDAAVIAGAHELAALEAFAPT
ncbi:MAG: hypothetical protein ACREN2_12535 [Candidatus Dormibacteria bacterium]